MPNANEDQVTAFRTYIDRQVAANQAFVSKLLGAKDIQEAVQIQVEHFQSQMKAAVNDAMQSFVKNVSEHRFTQGVVAIGGNRGSIAGRVKVPRTSGGAG